MPPSPGGCVPLVHVCVHPMDSQRSTRPERSPYLQPRVFQASVLAYRPCQEAHYFKGIMAVTGLCMEGLWSRSPPGGGGVLTQPSDPSLSLPLRQGERSNERAAVSAGHPRRRTHLAFNGSTSKSPVVTGHFAPAGSGPAITVPPGTRLCCPHAFRHP